MINRKFCNTLFFYYMPGYYLICVLRTPVRDARDGCVVVDARAGVNDLCTEIKTFVSY